MVTNETKNGRKFIKMYDPETGLGLRQTSTISSLIMIRLVR